MSGEAHDTTDQSAWSTSWPDEASDLAASELPAGALVDRYVVLGRVGRGAMGTVYDAHDPHLGRRVALKLVHAGSSSRQGQARLLREAQALARLTHPNVVAIHDAGIVGAQVWLAMELVAGRTLGAWLDERRRGWSEVLDVMLGAGRGLAAAHDKGLVHRDFKPDNVMIDADGRARVMDFGLAKPEHADELPARLPAAGATGLDALALPLTRADALVGTPAFMAPEQLLGRPIDARADQFAYCVTLWLALYGERPFAGDSLTTLWQHIRSGRPRPPIRGPSVPGWLRRAVLRGLSFAPDDRFPGMHALLGALARGHARARSRRALAGVAALGLFAGAAWAGQRLDEGRREAACLGLADAADAVWNDAARDRLQLVLRAVAPAHAEATAARLVPQLDAWATRWRRVRVGTCLLSAVRGAWDPDLRARADECLDERLARFSALVAALARADAAAAHQAVSAAARLAPPDACGDPTYLPRRPALPPAGRADVQEVRQALSHAAGLELTGQYAAGLAAAEAALVRAQALGWAPLVAEARALTGWLRHRTGADADAAALLSEAYVEAGTHGAVELAADVATKQVFVAARLARHGEAQVWARAAAVELAALGDRGEGLRSAALKTHLASALASAGDFAGARALHEQALATRERLLGPAHPEVAVSLNNLANVAEAVGARDEARALLTRVLELDARVHGEDHPELAQPLNNLALVYADQNDLEGARSLHARALALQERTLGPDHPELAVSLANLAGVLLGLGEPAEARVLAERALAIEERAYGPDHPAVAGSLTNLGNILATLGEHAAAEAAHARGLQIFERALGPDHPDLAPALYGLGELHWLQGHAAEADAHYARSAALFERHFGPEHPQLAQALLRRAEVALADRRGADALALAERTATIAALATDFPALLARARFLLARARRIQGEDAAAARALAQQARDAADDFTRGEIDAWLAEPP